MTTVDTLPEKIHASSFSVHPFPAALGAEIRGVDLRHIDADMFKGIKKAWTDHLLLVFRNQDLQPNDLVQVAARFGVVVASDAASEGKIRAIRADELPPEVIAVSNVRRDGKPLGNFGDAEVVWHSDYSYSERPAAARLLYGVECPPPETGGNTSFMNAYAAYDELPEHLKRKIVGKTVKQDNGLSVTMEPRAGVDLRQSVKDSPGPSHPLITTHPETGHNSLFLGRRSRAYINGMSVEESEKLLDELWAHACRPRFVYEHRWAPGDLVLWDNRCTMHKRTTLDPSTRRHLLAVQVVGHRPFEKEGALQIPRHPRFYTPR